MNTEIYINTCKRKKIPIWTDECFYMCLQGKNNRMRCTEKRSKEKGWL